MKTKTVKKLEQIIRESLNDTTSYNVHEQKIPKPSELKYTYDKNIKTAADRQQFRLWIRSTYPSITREKGLKSNEDFNTLKDADKTSQLQLLKSLWSQKNAQGISYGLAFLESERGITPNADTDTPWYKETSTWVGVGIVAFVALSLYLTLRGRRGVKELVTGAGGQKEYGWWKGRIARRAAGELAASRHPLTKTQIDQLVDMLVTFRRGDRKKTLEKWLSGQFPPDIVPEVAAAIADNPAACNKITLELSGTAAEQFIIGNRYMTEAELELAMGRRKFRQNASELRQRRAKRTGKTPATKTPATKKPATKKPLAAITIVNKGKLKGKMGMNNQEWWTFKNGTASEQDISNACKKAMGDDATMKGKIELVNHVTAKLNRKLGTKEGTWLLDKHLNANTFPEFSAWEADLNAAGRKGKLDQMDYWISKTIWNLTR